MAAKTFADIVKFNPYHDSQGRFASANAATSFTYAPGKSHAHDKAIQRGKDAAGTTKGFSGTLYHGSPSTEIEEFDISRAGANTSSGEKLIYFTDSKQMADDFSYERIDGDSKFTQKRGKKGRVYEVDVEMKNPLDFRKLTDKDVENLLKLDADGLLTPDLVRSLSGNHQLLKASLNLNAENLKSLGYDGLIANTGKAGHNSLEYAVVDSKQAKIRKSAPIAKTFDEVLKFNPYHDSRGRFASANSATSFTIRTRDPGKQHLADAAASREREMDAASGGKTPTKEESPGMKAVHDIEDKIRNQHYETAAVVDKNGSVLINKDGGKSQVGFTPMECLMMKNNTLTHNHPSSSMFSTEDAQCFVKNNLQEIRATTREGKTYCLRRGKYYTNDQGNEFVREYNKRRHIAQAYAQNDLDSRGFREKIWSGEITQEQANREFSRVMTNQMIEWTGSNASNYGVEFEVESRKVTKSYDADEYTMKATDNEEEVLFLDKESNEEMEAAFLEWLNREPPTEKEDLRKFNPYHGPDGRFATASGGGGAGISSETEQYLKKYTSGKYRAACAISQEIEETGNCDKYIDYTKQRGKFSMSGQEVTTDDYNNLDLDIQQTKEIMKAIDAQPATKDELVRIEPSRGTYSVGDELTWGIRSTSADIGFADKAIRGDDEGLRTSYDHGHYKNGVTEYHITGEKKALNIEEYSDYDQSERLVKGKFKVVNVREVTFTPEKGVSFDDAIRNNPTLSERFVSFTSKKGNPMVRDTETGETYPQSRLKNMVFHNGELKTQSYLDAINETKEMFFTKRTVVELQQVNPQE